MARVDSIEYMCYNTTVFIIGGSGITTIITCFYALLLLLIHTKVIVTHIRFMSSVNQCARRKIFMFGFDHDVSIWQE